MTGDFQRGDIIFPMAMRQDWLTDNLTIFDFTLDHDDMATIDGRLDHPIVTARAQAWPTARLEPPG